MERPAKRVRRAACAAAGVGAMALLLTVARPCALLPVPPSAPLSRSPSTALDRWPQPASPVGPATGPVSMLPEPVERPVAAYLHKFDNYYNRIVPNWQLQYKTAEQQFLYEGDFTVIVRELTEEGCIVQDSVAGILGFVPFSEFGDQMPSVGEMVKGARCTSMDNTIYESPDVTTFRMQTGIVFEWDDALGEGYIIPTEDQEARNMLRVLRRDIQWRDSRRLIVGQFVQFETALPDEVPIDANDDPRAPFALRVRCPEVMFSFQESYVEDAWVGPKGRFAEVKRPVSPVSPTPALAEEAATTMLKDREPSEQLAYTMQEEAGPLFNQPQVRHVMPVESGRPGPDFRASHPVLQRFKQEDAVLASAASPVWLWEAPMKYEEEEDWDPIVPLQLKRMPAPKPRIRIFTHEVAVKRGDYWREPAFRAGLRDFDKTRPPDRATQETMSLAAKAKRERATKRDIRRQKIRAASLQRVEQQQRQAA